VTLPHPQAEDLLAKCDAYEAGELSLVDFRSTVGEAAAAADGELREALADAKSRLDRVEEGSDGERDEAGPLVAEVAAELRDYLPSG
jgi:hypothetical protein